MGTGNKAVLFPSVLPEQPDLNWENPQVRKEIYDMILWWMEKELAASDWT